MTECGRVGATLEAPPCGVGARGQTAITLPYFNRQWGVHHGEPLMLIRHFYSAERT